MKEREIDISYEKKRLEEIILILKLQMKMISNPWKKLMINQYLKFIEKELRTVEPGKNPVEYLINILMKRLFFLKNKEGITNFEEQWIETFIELLKTIRQETICRHIDQGFL